MRTNDSTPAIPSIGDQPTANPTSVGDLPTAGDSPKVPTAPIQAIPGYEILGELGRGGMGVVYRARHVALGRTVALKVVLAGGHASPKARARFRAEAEAVATLQHPGIVQVFEVGETDGLPFCALEYCPNGSLADMFGRKPRSPREAARIVEQLARAVQHAHNIIHRDLKPANVLVGEGGVLKVTDFGLAKQTDGESELTATGAVMGTPAYMSPEQARGESRGVGPAADVWALGVILYEALTGTRPFGGETMAATLDAVRNAEPVPLRQQVRSVPRDLEVIALKCLSKDAVGRYASAEALADDLRRWQEGMPITARPVGRAERAAKWVRRNPVVTALLVGVVLALAGGAAVATWFGLDAREQAKQAEIARGKEKERADGEEKAKDVAETRRIEAEAAKEIAETRRQETEAEKTKTEKQLVRAEMARYAITLDLAYRAWEQKDLIRVSELLEGTKRELRDWEYGHLRVLERRTSLPLLGHAGWVECVAISVDGKRIVTGSADKSGCVWDAQTGQVLLSLKGHTSRITSVAMSQDGKCIVTGSADKTARVWDAETGQQLHSLKGHTGFVTSVAISVDGKRIVTGSADQTARVWEVATSQETLTLKGHTTSITSVTMSQDGKRIVTGSQDQTARVWDAQTGQELLTLKGHTGVVWSVTISMDGKRIVTGGFDSTARVWDAQTGRELLLLKGSAGEVYSVAMSADGRRIVAGSLDTRAHVWDAETGQELISLQGHTVGVKCVAMSQDGKRIVTGSNDKTACVWDTATGQKLHTLRSHTGFVTSTAISRDGNRIVTGSWDHTARVWDTQTGQELLSLKGFAGVVYTVAMSRDGNRIVTGNVDQGARVWDSQTGEQPPKTIW